MGCASSKPQQPQLIRLPTVTGVLRVTIVNARIQHETSSVFAMDPYFKIKVSNQAATSKIIRKGGKEPIFNESFEFFINSCYQTEGRHLELELWDSNKTSDSLIGFGMLDLDTILQPNADQKPKNMRLFLNYDIKPAGVVNVEFQFKEQPFGLMNFRFETVSIRRKTSSVGNMNCFVRLTIGEQVLKTKKKKDTVEMPPVWTDQILTVNVPKIIKNCLIEVLDDGELVGECTLKVEDLLKETKEKHYDEDILYKDAIAGTLRFQTIIGQNVQFSEIKRDYKRKTEAKKQEPKPELKEVEKGKTEQIKKQGQKQKPKDSKQAPTNQTEKPKQQPKK